MLNIHVQLFYSNDPRYGKTVIAKSKENNQNRLNSKNDILRPNKRNTITRFLDKKKRQYQQSIL